MRDVQATEFFKKVLSASDASGDVTIPKVASNIPVLFPCNSAIDLAATACLWHGRGQAVVERVNFRAQDAHAGAPHGNDLRPQGLVRFSHPTETVTDDQCAEKT